MSSNMVGEPLTMCQKIEDDKMGSVVSLSDRLIREAMIEHGVKKPEARRIIAREIGVPPGALERLACNRLIHIERVANRINAYVVRRIESQIRRLEGELEVARLKCAAPDAVAISSAQAAVDEARRLICAER
jgi:hypothetical protein